MSEIVPALQWHRRLTDKVATSLAVACVLLVMLPLAAIFIYLVIRGIGSLNLAFFTQIPRPVGETGGGMANAIVGSIVILLIGSVIGVPLGVGSGVYLSEY